MADDELKALMTELIKSQNQILEEFQRNQVKRKDKWDKFSSISALISVVPGVLIAILGLHFTNVYAERQASYNEHQAAYNKQQAQHDNDLKSNEIRLTSIQAVGQLMPYLTSANQRKKELALLLASKLTDPEKFGQLDVGQLGVIFKGKGSIKAMTSAALTGNEREKQTALEGLAKLAIYGKGEDKKLSAEALQQVSAGSQFLYTGRPGETIKVEIISDKKPRFSASLDKKELTIEGSSFTFDLSKRKGQTNYLLITTKGDVGDVYKVQISGDSPTTLKQIIRQTDREVTHTFLFKIE